MNIDKPEEYNDTLNKDINMIRTNIKNKQLDLNYMTNKLDDLVKINNAINLYIQNETNRNLFLLSFNM